MSKPISPTKVCCKCGKEKPNEEMKSKGKSKRTGERLAKTVCKECDNKRIREQRKLKRPASYIERQRKSGAKSSLRAKYQRWKKYGITKEEFEKLVIDQGGACLICRKTDRPLVVDHCHVENKFRGLICAKCNSMLGMAGDSIEVLKSGIDYLLSHKLKVA